jgi:tRNA dimethylallyltransferase
MPDAKPDFTLRDKLFAQEEKEPGFLHKELTKLDPEEAMKHHPKSTRYLVRALEIYHTTGQTKTESFVQQPVQRPLLMIGLRRDKEETNKRINARIKAMLKE